MSRRIWGGALIALALVTSVASARNFHCAGGIQYVIQGMAEKGKGNLDDAHRIFGKAIAQLNQCTSEDPNDNEAWAYYAWAYAELDSAPQAGAAFDEAEKRLAGDPKKLPDVKNNRHHYWVEYYNQGLARYKDAGAIVPVQEIPNSTDPNVGQAKAKLAEAEVAFAKAVAISSHEMLAYNNLAIVQALQGKFADASATVERGLAIDPNDKDLKERLGSMRANNVVEKEKAGDYAGALADLEGELTKNPNDYNVLVQAAQVSFEMGDKTKDKDAAGAKAAYLKAMGYYGRAAEAAPSTQDKHDMRFNQAIAAQNAGDDLNEAKIAFQMIQDTPKDRNLHAMLRGAYDRMGSKKKSGDEVWVILGLNDQATTVADIPGYTAKVAKTSDAGKVLAAQGPPEEIKQFKADQSVIDLWFYWTKHQTFAFSTGRQVGAANFAEFGPESFDKTDAANVGAGGAKGARKPAATKPAGAKPAAKPPVKKS